ncbi:MAG: FkbM family methyltransferase [Elusimicrobiales bacterium]|nr:FkbM family methyltransferase [Elusimicrobiales bacterium]
MIKKLVKRAFSAIGYDIRRNEQAGFNARYLASICSPKTVFDVGVGRGTPELYKAFPHARFFLIEPLEEFGGTLETLSSALDCKIYRKALGAVPGEAEISVEKDPQLSSLQNRASSSGTAVKRKVEISTLDAILAENPGLSGPVLLKIDTEGFELEVLKGGVELLKISDYVIAEVSISGRFKGGYDFADIIAFMRERGFSVFDFLSICRGPDGPGANLTDIMFKKNS